MLCCVGHDMVILFRNSIVSLMFNLIHYDYGVL